MTLEVAFKDLTAKWERLAEELEQGLLWSVTETKPAEEHALATHYVDAATDLIAAAGEGLAACRAAGPRRVEPRGDRFIALTLSGAVQYPRGTVSQRVGVVRAAPPIKAIRPREGGGLARLGGPRP